MLPFRLLISVMFLVVVSFVLILGYRSKLLPRRGSHHSETNGPLAWCGQIGGVCGFRHAIGLCVGGSIGDPYDVEPLYS